MEKLKSCLERIRVIRGVNNGIITEEQLQHVFLLYGLNPEQEEQVMEVLRNSDIHVAAEEIGTSSFRGQNSEIYDKVQCPTDKCSRTERFEIVLLICMEDIWGNVQRIEQYRKEIQVLKNAVSESDDRSAGNVYSRTVRAMVAVSYYRARERMKNGWVCGTYISHICSRLEKWLSSLFSEEELSRFIENCKDDCTPDSHSQEIILILVHYAPNILVHRYRTLTFPE